MKVLDRRGRTVYEIDGVSETIGDGLNLVTEYRYDNLNRVVQVINPAGQSIEYTYDDWGNVASTNQVDMGRVDYSYDKHGMLRFSQTREQRQRGKVLSQFEL